MASYYFDKGTNRITNSDDELVFYQCFITNGIGEESSIQVEWETKTGKRGEILFDPKNTHIKENGNDFYLI